MQFVLPLIAIAILGIVEMSLVTDHKPSTTPSPTPKDEVQETPTITIVNSPTIPLTKSPTPTTPSPTTENSQQTNTSVIYPSAKVTLNSSSEINLETSDSAESVTNWYKNYINTNGMNTTSFVTTNTNANVLNRLVGSGNGKKIDVEISRNSSDSVTKIKINLGN